MRQKTGLDSGKLRANFRKLWVADLEPSGRPICESRVFRTLFPAIYLREGRFQKRGPPIMNETAEQVRGARQPIQPLENKSTIS